MSTKEFFGRFTNISKYLKASMEDGIAKFAKREICPTIYPILLLLAKLRPSPAEDANVVFESFKPLVEQCLICPNAKVTILIVMVQIRIVASKILSIMEADPASRVTDLVILLKEKNANKLNGYLLLINDLIARCKDSLYGIRYY